MKPLTSLKINFKRSGSGAGHKQILILHGWGSSVKSWAKVQNDLADYGFEVIVPDMPGFGESDPPPAPWNGEAYLNWLLGFIESQKLKTPINVVGHSFGGGLAIKLAVEYPGLVDNLILLGAARMGRKRKFRKKMLNIVAKAGRIIAFLPGFELIRKGFYKFVVGSRDYEKTTGNMRETIKIILKENLSPQVHKIKAPTMIIWGDRDRATPIEDAYFINREIKGSSLEIITGYGHALNIECPEKIAKIISKFIKK